jgi:hypothetical protein
MNVETGTEAAHFPEKEYINGIFLAVRFPLICQIYFHLLSDNCQFFAAPFAYCYKS